MLLYMLDSLTNHRLSFVLIFRQFQDSECCLIVVLNTSKYHMIMWLGCRCPKLNHNFNPVLILSEAAALTERKAYWIHML